MQLKLKTILVFLLTGLYCYPQGFYNTGTIQKIEVTFTQPNWDYMMDTAALNSGGYLMGTVKINGVLYDSVGVKYKGNSSFDSTYQKNPMHIELDTYKSQDHQGYQDIKLSNCYQDPSMIREVLAYDILKNYMHCPKANFAQVYINGTYRGVYSNTESINKTFCANHFFSSSGTFIKCNPNVNPSTNTKCNLKKLTGDSSAYFNFYEIKSSYGWKQLEALSDSVTNKASNISSIIDVDRAIWMLAFNNVLVNLDSYSGAFCQNYYLYKDQTQHYNTVVWDLNMSFGGFPFLGNLNSSLASLSIANMQNLPPSIHSTDTYWPLIQAIYNNPFYKRMYIAHMKTIVQEMFASNQYITTYNQYKALIDTAVQSDTKKFFTYTQFQNALTTNYSVGSYSVPGIQTLMNGRISYLQGTSDFSASSPTISGAGSAVTTPSLNSAVTITANVTNELSNSVYLGYRFSAASKFTRVLMYDDGLHNDGAAGDNIFGASFTLITNQAQYYIYAENAASAIFSPERAEHEYHSVFAVQSPSAGQVVINEFLANNLSDVKNEFNLYEDWIELYNNSAAPLSLGGYYLTDDYANKTKYAFPQNTVIQPNGFLIVWADNLTTGGTQLHANFKLNNNGEQIMLSDGLTGVIDSVSFGTQAADVTTGRCPDGTGSLSVRPATTYSMSNCAVGISENRPSDGFLEVFPNPASQSFIIHSSLNSPQPVEIINVMGQVVYRAEFAQLTAVDASGWSNGVYFVKCNNITRRIIINN
jgi:hypothetical protein